MDNKERFVIMKLRVANRDDFSDQFGNKRLGVMYFCKNKDGIIEKKPNYFKEDIDMITFKQLYANQQIYVPLGLFDEVEVWEEDQDMKSA